jgi:hypothetical protein
MFLGGRYILFPRCISTIGTSIHTRGARGTEAVILTLPLVRPACIARGPPGLRPGGSGFVGLSMALKDVPIDEQL